MMLPSHRPTLRRAGHAAVEVVMVTSVLIPVAAFLLFLGFRAWVNLNYVINTLVDWPIM